MNAREPESFVFLTAKKSVDAASAFKMRNRVYGPKLRPRYSKPHDLVICIVSLSPQGFGRAFVKS
jgi:hypothetical protein